MPEPSPGVRPAPKLEIRAARLGDLPTLVRMYRAQDPATRALYHPFPFDPVRATLSFGFLIESRRMVRMMMRRRPQRAYVLLVACRAGERRPVAYGTTSFRRTENGSLRAVFGYLVDPSARGLGVGTWLHIAMIESAVQLGVVRGGGMVVATNRTNLRVLEKLGFTITESDVVDKAVPDAKNFVTDGDLPALLAKWRAAQAAPATA